MSSSRLGKGESLPIKHGETSDAERPGFRPAFVSLGSNLEPRADYIRRAIEALDSHPRVRVIAVSNFFESAPAGEATGPDFLNAAVHIETDLSPVDLKFSVLRPIEADLGRVRTADKNAPRTIDLDIALYDDEVIDDPDNGLQIPDPDILTCAHVAVPLAEVAGERRHPEHEEPIRSFANSRKGPA